MTGAEIYDMIKNGSGVGHFLLPFPRKTSGVKIFASVAQSVEQLIRNYQTGPQKIEYATVAQSVEQLIRNQQVVCSSHITSSTKSLEPCGSRDFCLLRKINLLVTRT